MHQTNKNTRRALKKTSRPQQAGSSRACIPCSHAITHTRRRIDPCVTPPFSHLGRSDHETSVWQVWAQCPHQSAAWPVRHSMSGHPRLSITRRGIVIDPAEEVEPQADVGVSIAASPRAASSPADSASLLDKLVLQATEEEDVGGPSAQADPADLQVQCAGAVHRPEGEEVGLHASRVTAPGRSLKPKAWDHATRTQIQRDL